MQAGTDVDCGGFVTSNAFAALAQGLISESDIDTVLRRLFRVRLRLGQFDPPGPLSTIGMDQVIICGRTQRTHTFPSVLFSPTQVCTPEHIELARDGARQSIVLAKNDGGLLPLSPAAFASPVVIGPLTLEIGINCTTYYGSNPCPNTATNSEPWGSMAGVWMPEVWLTSIFPACSSAHGYCAVHSVGGRRSWSPYGQIDE